MADEEWRPTPLSREMTIIFMVCSVWSLGWVVVTASDNGAPVDGDVAAAVIFASLTLSAWRFGLHPRIRASQAGVEVVNPVRTTFVDWDDVVACGVGYWGVVIERSSAGSVTAWAVQRTNLSPWMGRTTRADRVAARIAELADLSRSGRW